MTLKLTRAPSKHLLRLRRSPARRVCAALRVAVVAVTSLSASAALAADIYVDASAPDGGDGSQASPFKVLQDGIDAAAPGDTVRVLPGTYAPIQTSTDGADGARITVVAEPPLEAVVAVEVDDQVALRAQHTHHTFDGLVFDGGYHHRDAVLTDGADHLELLGVEVRRSDRDCVDLRTVTDVLIADSYIHHCVNGQDGEQLDAHGVTGDAVFGLTIRDTEIYMVSGDSVQLSPPREPWDDLVIEGCVLWNAPLDEAVASLPVGAVIGENALDTKVGDELNGGGQRPSVHVIDTVVAGWRGAISNQGAFNLKEEIDAVIERVTVRDSEIAFRLRAPATVRVQNAVVEDVDVGFRLEDGLDGARLLHNTIGALVGAAFTDAGGDPVGLVVKNNLLLGDLVPAPADGDPSNMAAVEGAFVDVAGGDYHLVAGAAAIDAGEALAEVSDDRDGAARPLGEGVDVGAYEWSETPPTTGGETDSDTDSTTSDGTGSTGGGASDSDATASAGGTSDSGSGGGETEGASTGGATGSATSGSSATAGATTSGGADDEDGSGCACAVDEGDRGLGLLALTLLLALRRRGRASVRVVEAGSQRSSLQIAPKRRLGW